MDYLTQARTSVAGSIYLRYTFSRFKLGLNIFDLSEFLGHNPKLPCSDQSPLCIRCAWMVNN